MIQGSSADITKTAVLLFWNYIIKNNLFNTVKICNIVHDEIIIECPKDMEEECASKMLQCMRDAGNMFFTRVKLDASSDAGDHWIH